MKTYERMKESAKALAIAYAILGSILYNGLYGETSYLFGPLAGHQSVDLVTGRSQPAYLEKGLLKLVGLDANEIRIK